MKQNLKNPAVLALFAVCMLNGAAFGMNNKTNDRINVFINHIKGDDQDKQLVLHTTSNEENGVLLPDQLIKNAQELENSFDKETEKQSLTEKNLNDNRKSSIQEISELTAEQFKNLHESYIKSMLATDVAIAAHFVKCADKHGATYETFFKHVTQGNVENITLAYNECAEIFLKHCKDHDFLELRYKKDLKKVLLQAVNQDNFIAINKHGAALFFLADKAQDIVFKQQWISYVTADNLQWVNRNLLERMIEASTTSSFNSIVLLINESNMDACYYVVDQLLAIDASCASVIAKNCYNSTNIHGSYWNIANLIKADSSLVSYFVSLINESNLRQCSYIISKLNDIDKSCAATIAKNCYNSTNIHKHLYAISYLVEADSSLLDYFVSLINESNLEKCCYVISQLVKIDASCAAILVKFYNAENIHTIGYSAISDFIKADTSLLQHLLSLINTSNIEKCAYVVYQLIQLDKSCASQIAKNCYNTSTIIHAQAEIIVECIKADKSLLHYFVSLINEGNIAQADKIIATLVKFDVSCLFTIVQNAINENNISKIDFALLIIAGHASEDCFNYIKNIKGFQTLMQSQENCDCENEPLEITIFGPTKLAQHHLKPVLRETFQSFQQKTILEIRENIRESLVKGKLIGIPTKKAASWQHFVQNHADVLMNLSAHLIDKQLAQVLFKMLKREWLEQEKGRYVLYHAQKMDTAYCNMIYTRLLVLYYNETIDKESWFAPRCNLSDKNLPYDQLFDLVKKGRTTDEQRPHLQFANASLFGNTNNGGSCSFGYLADNSNVGSFKFTPEELFKQFNLEKYAQKYAHVFEKLEKLVGKCKKGTMLMYSFTKEALDAFTYATSASGGYKESEKHGKYQLMINGKNAIDAPTHEIIDTLRNNPEYFDKQNFKNELNYSDAHEYVIVITDDHPNDKDKLGSANPFNQDMRCYHVHVEPQAYLIEKILDQLFEKIKEDIKNDKTTFVQKEMNVKSNL